MKRIILIIISLLTVRLGLFAVQSYPTYRGSGRLWQQSPEHAMSNRYRQTQVLGSVYTAFQYSPSSSTLSGVATTSSAVVHHSCVVARNGVSVDGGLVGTSAVVPGRVVALSGDMHPFELGLSPKFAPPGGAGGGTGDEEEPDPTKIDDVPIGDGMIFVMLLVLIYFIILVYRSYEKNLFFFDV